MDCRHKDKICIRQILYCGRILCDGISGCEYEHSNADRIRGMSDEELAGFLMGIALEKKSRLLSLAVDGETVNIPRNTESILGWLGDKADKEGLWENR